MSILHKIAYWLGITTPRWLHCAVATRNMPFIMVGSLLAVFFAGMLVFFLATGTPCPVDGFDEVVYKDPERPPRFLIASLAILVGNVVLFVYSLLYFKKKWEQPAVATVATVVFAFLMVMMWGMAEAGGVPAQQVLIFASIQFLMAGLIVFDPLISIAFFIVTYGLFSLVLGLSGQATAHDQANLVYLASFDLVVSWVVYGLFMKGASHVRYVADQYRRDELTGAKNRHYLRDDISEYVGADLFVMLCDVDDFKRYNDEYSHDTGDAVLREFCLALRDSFGDEGTYRYGGDEFLIVSFDINDEELAYRHEKIKAQMAKVSVEGEEGMLHYSGGYVRGVPADVPEFRAMLHRADENLLKAKKMGKNRLLGN